MISRQLLTLAIPIGEAASDADGAMLRASVGGMISSQVPSYSSTASRMSAEVSV